MATSFLLQELDDHTRDYLLSIKENEGRGAPGIYVPINNSRTAVSCCFGVLIIGVMMPVTLFSSMILADPGGVALLQTAVLLLGGWLIFYAIRVNLGKKSSKVAGYWAYADPLFLYEAGGEQIKVTPVEDVIEAQFTHNYNNGAYQNSIVRILLAGKNVVSMQVNDERRAERMVVFFNYLAWARGPEGGERADLPPATLGGLAKYVAHNENEPLDAEGNVNLNMVELDGGDVPDNPRREGRAMPNFLPYLVMIGAGVVIYFGMIQVNIPRRDNEIYDLVSKEPTEPRILRAYLTDERNKIHRDKVLGKLSTHYENAKSHTSTRAADPTLKQGFLKVLDTLKTANQPVLSIRVKETKAPANSTGSDERVKTLRTAIADRTNEEYAKAPGLTVPVAPGGGTWKVTPPPIGHQLIAYVEAPDDAANAHVLVEYSFDPTAPNVDEYKVKYTVTLRSEVEQGPDATKVFTLPGLYSVKKTGFAPGVGGQYKSVTNASKDVAEAVIRDMVGLQSAPPIVPGIAPPKGFGPGLKF